MESTARKRPSTRPSSAKSSPDTLLDAAEELFGHYGLEAVSLNQVRKHAGSRHASVIQYHFGTKRDLVRAVFERRAPRINKRRNELLDRVDRTGDSEELRQLLSALIKPLVEEGAASGKGRNYVLFVDSMRRSPDVGFATIMDAHHMSGLHRIVERIEQIQSDLPRREVRLRFRLIQSWIIESAADWERRRTRGEDPSGAEYETYVNMVTRMCVAAIAIEAQGIVRAT